MDTYWNAKAIIIGLRLSAAMAMIASISILAHFGYTQAWFLCVSVSTRRRVAFCKYTRLLFTSTTKQMSVCIKVRTTCKLFRFSKMSSEDMVN